VLIILELDGAGERFVVEVDFACLVRLGPVLEPREALANVFLAEV
jgi:hypothetical protein